MTKDKTAAIVLAAGLGTRMESRLPKVLHPLAGRPMIGHLMETLAGMDLERIVVVVGDDMEAVAEAVAPHPTVVQKERLGTGHAVRTACEAVDGFDGTVLVLYADAPLISVETLTRMIEARRRAPRPAVVVLGFRPSDPGPYGRLIVGADGTLQAIVEAGDATPGQGAIALCNAGVMAIDGRPLPGLLARIGTDNAKGEVYLTDIVAMARGDGLTCAVVEGDEAELIGVNSRADLARAEAVVQQRLRAAAMAGGATLADPETVYFSHDTRLGRDVTVAHDDRLAFLPGPAARHARSFPSKRAAQMFRHQIDTMLNAPLAPELHTHTWEELIAEYDIPEISP